jgi:hypothetical protein
VTMNDWPKSFPTKELYDGGPGTEGFDFLNIMVYDNPAPHATLKHAQTGLDTWIKTKGLPKAKCILGCPFYGSANGGVAYRNIVAADPAAAWVDKDGAEDYNSIPTIKKKTQMALDQAGGIMFWELSQDATGDLSLLSAVDQVIAAHGTGVLPPIREYGVSWTAGSGDVGAMGFRRGVSWQGRGAPGYLLSHPEGSPWMAIDAAGRSSLPLVKPAAAAPKAPAHRASAP